MIIKVTIRDSEIVSAILYRNEDRTDGIMLKHTGTKLVFNRRWNVQLDASRILCESVRRSKTSAVNVVTYKISYGGLAEQRLTDGLTSKVIKVERVFRRPGNFSGVLSLIYNKNGHRFASFLSDEYAEFLKKKNLQWIVQKDPAQFTLELKGKYRESLIEKTEHGYAVCRAKLRELYTDGTLTVTESDECSTLHIVGGSWVILVKHHTESEKTERILLTKRNFTELDSLPLI
ncbi:MAG: hypothetical protein IK130_06590 [Oscillospiraceae bacterium]|nr:hypothetical protein [Oscillospiraceae bacterium]